MRCSAFFHPQHPSRSAGPRAAVMALALSAVACAPDISVDSGETHGTLPAFDAPTVEFDPANGVIAFPNNLLINPGTGKVTLPEACNESASSTALREQVLNALDGFGTFKAAIRATFSKAADAASFTSSTVKIYRRATGSEAVAVPGAAAVPFVAIAGTTARYDAECTATTAIDSVTLVPLVPLTANSTYTVALLDGLQTATGAPFIASPTWALVRQANDPVTVVGGQVTAHTTSIDQATPEGLVQLLGVDRLWKAHDAALTFLDGVLGADHARTEVLAAWDFNTQTTTAPLDATVSGSLAAELPTDALGNVVSLATLSGATALQVMQGALTTSVCAQLGCASVGDVLQATLTAPNYQTEATNPLAGGDPLPGPWSDPIAPTKISDATLRALAFVPATAAPAGGYPTVVFGHGITRQKEDLFALGSQLAAAGMASISIDWVAHGGRAIQYDDDATLGCDVNDLVPTSDVACFSPIFSSNLAGTRDNLRQSILDGLALVQALKACDTTECGALKVDPERIGFLGQSLGSIIGNAMVAMSPDIQAAVFNVGGVGYVDIIENTDSLALRCSLVDALITAGVITGDPYDASAGTGLCTTPADYLTQAGWLQFAVLGRWVLDPADGANFAGSLLGRPVLLQDVEDDAVVPNISTETLGALLGLTMADADMSISATPSATTAITSSPTSAHWLRYANLAADAGSGFPGNTYGHGSLLSPASSGNDGALGVARMQTDAITYLVLNL